MIGGVIFDFEKILQLQKANQKMQTTQIEQNFFGTSKAYDLGRGERSDPMEGVPHFAPGPGRYDLPREFDSGKIGGFE